VCQETADLAEREADEAALPPLGRAASWCVLSGSGGFTASQSRPAGKRKARDGRVGGDHCMVGSSG
jgi:hypothetical protein